MEKNVNKKIGKGEELMQSLYENCRLCGRECGIDRTKGNVGVCKMTDKMKIARASLHRWEEPPVSAVNGSGTVFFTGCSLGCVFCQNRDISRGGFGREVTPRELSDIFIKLQNEGAHNINLVTPTHYAPGIREALILAKSRGLSVPIVYNTASYDSVSTLKMLDGIVDIYLPDFKYLYEKTAAEYSSAGNYTKVAKEAIREMYRQSGSPVIENGIMKKGIIARILLLPNHIAEAKLILKYLYSEYGDGIYISLMNQYTPMPNMKSPLDRKVTHAEYRELVGYAERLGVKNCFIQEFGTASESFIPQFDLSGVDK